VTLYIPVDFLRKKKKKKKMVVITNDENIQIN
jgi:FMN phosphatase YigB (HAD superfamily)